MRVRTAITLLLMMMYAAVAAAQDRVSLRPNFKAGDENRYTISASVETTVTPKGVDGIGGTSRGELTATVLVRTLRASNEGEVDQEAVVEAISFSSSKAGVVSPPGSKEIAGKKIEFGMNSAGHLLRCVIPDSPGYLTLADLLFSVTRWYPAGEVAVGGSWEAPGRGHPYTEKLSEASMGATTVYKLASLAKGLASIEGAVTLNQRGSSVFNPGGGFVNVSVVAGGKGTARIDMDVSAGRMIGGTTEGRVEGTLVNIQPTAAGEKMQPREGSLVETSKFSIKLVQ
jgi:hypothetical protein